MSLTDDDRIDPLLRDWRKSLDCDDAQKLRMREQLFANLTSQVVTLPPKIRSKDRISAAAWIGVCVSLAIGVLLFNTMTERTDGDSEKDWALETFPYRFTSEDLRRTEKIATEVDRLFENQVKAVSLVGDRLQLHFEEGTNAEKGPRLILRFLLQNRSPGENAEWKNVHTEELIGHRDHQLEFADSSNVNIEYWSHLLPDNSLWIEAKTIFGEKTFSMEVRCLANQPHVLWSDASKGDAIRLIFVYELLGTTEGGLI